MFIKIFFVLVLVMEQKFNAQDVDLSKFFAIINKYK